jgi:purine-binding chemotaxis protein CheW
MSFRMKVNLPEVENTNKTRIIIIKLEPNAPVGIIVDAVKEVVTLTDNNIDAASRSSTNNDPTYINGIGKTGGTLISLLDLNVVISEKETA